MSRTPLLASLCFFPFLLVACGGGSDPAGHGGSGGATSTTTTTTGHTSAGYPPSTSSSAGGCGQGGQGGSGEGVVSVSAGMPQTVPPGSLVQLQGSAMSSTCGATLEYAWSQWKGQAVTLDDPSSPTPTFTAPAAYEVLGFELVVTDDEGGKGASSVGVTVGAQPPSAHAGPDKGALGGATVKLEGSGSDPANLPLVFAWKQISGPTVALDDPSSATPALVVATSLVEPVVFELTVKNSYASSAPDWVTVRRLAGADTDGDLLEDDVEIALGTDPEDADTDHDGIPDGWEVLGHEGVDYPALGCDPRHHDLLVELVVQEFVKNGTLHSARPSAGVLAALVDFYAGLPLSNLDGLPGVALHFVDGPIIEDEGFWCNLTVGTGCWVYDAPGSFLYREAFHKASICLNILSGCADIGGQKLAVSHGGLDGDPANDLDEPAARDFYRLFIHEMGHNLGLRHGGNTSLNYKPNYASVMNYAYGGSSAIESTIATGPVMYSRGLLPSLDECALVEQGVFAAVPPEQRAVLASYHDDQGWTVGDDGSIDWDHDGSIASAPYALVIRSDPGDQPSCSLLTDHDDLAAIEQRIGTVIASSPSAPPAAAWLEIGNPEPRSEP